MLKLELEIELGELQETWHFASLEKIFIENRIYRDIEECETWEEILKAIHDGLKPHIKHLLRAVTDEDVTRLTEIRIKRISKFDSFKADEKIASLETDIERVKGHLNTLTEYAIEWFKNLKAKYGKGRERKTELRTFAAIDRSKVAVANAKLYWNAEEGFVGTGLKRGEGELIGTCSDIDNIIVFRKDGTMQVSKVSSKAFFGKGLIHVAVWKKGTNEPPTTPFTWTEPPDGAWSSVSTSPPSHATGSTRLPRVPPNRSCSTSPRTPTGRAEVVTVHLKTQARLKSSSSTSTSATWASRVGAQGQPRVQVPGAQG